MAKKKENARDITLEQIALQGILSRFNKADKAFDKAADIFPSGGGMEGTDAEIRQAIKHLNSAAENLAEMMAFRTMVGIK